jgi:hypothetical protein
MPMMDKAALQENAIRYSELCGITLDLPRPLGDGTDGVVWKSSVGTAVKAFFREHGYFNERDAYLRLAEWGIVHKIDGFWIPSIVDYNDRLLVIEMEVMTDPPYILDFAKVRIDRPPDFPEDVVEQHERQCHEWFAHHWPEVQQLMATLEGYGIYYLDPRPGNIVFADLR